MKKFLLFKILFSVLLLLTIWVCIKQCRQANLSDAFADADTAIRNGFSEQQQNLINGYWSMDLEHSRYKRPGNQAVLDGFKQLQVMHRSYHLFLDSIRTQLLLAAGLSTTLPLATQNVQENHSVVKQLLLRGQGNILAKINARTDSLRVAMLALTGQNKEYLPVEFSTTAQGRYMLYGYTGNLCDLPLAGGLAMLSNLQAAAIESMYKVMYYCFEKISSNFCGFDRFTVGGSWESSYVLSGDSYSADFFLGGYPGQLSYVKNAKVLINGQSVPLNNGVAHYEESNCRGIGRHILKVKITGNILRWEGGKYNTDTLQTAKEFAFQVRSAHPQIHLSMQPPFLYAYTANPLSISAWDEEVTNNDIRVACTNAVLEKIGGGRYILKPNSLAPVTLKAGRVATFQYEVRPLPDPVPVFDNFKSGNVILRELLDTQTALQIRFPPDFDFQVNCKILNFHLTRFRGREDPEVADNQGEQFNASIRELLKTARPGDRLLFDEIRVKCGEEPSPRTLAGLSLRVE